MPSVILLLALLAAPSKLAVMPLAAGQGVDAATAAAVTEAMVAELRRRPDLQVITPHEVNALLSLEKQKAALGCQEESCFAEIGGALGVERMVSGDLARLGKSWLVHLKLLEVKKARVAAQAFRRLKGATIDEVLDALPPMAGELFPGTAAAAPPSTPIPPAPGPLPEKPPPAPPRPPPGVDEPLELPAAARSKLLLFTDGKGQYLAVSGNGGLDGPLLAGDGKRFHTQRLIGASRDSERLGFNFWEPRARYPAEAAFDVEGGKGSLVCGDKKVAFAAVPEAEARTLLSRAQLFQPRWRRYLHALARDDEGRYWLVEGARDKSGSPLADADFWLFVGPKGNLAGRPVSDAVRDEGGELFLTSAGKLRFFRESDKAAAEWVEGTQRLRLVALEVEANAPMVYRTLGIYRGERLGTPCDGRF